MNLWEIIEKMIDFILCKLIISLILALNTFLSHIDLYSMYYINQYVTYTIFSSIFVPRKLHFL